MGVYGSSTLGIYGVAVYGPDTSTPAPPPPPTDTPSPPGTPLPPPDTSPDAGPGPRPQVTGGDVIKGAIPQFSVQPFNISQTAYGQFYLTWTIPPHSADPTADWRFFRLLRSDAGIPVSYTDGAVLMDVDAWHSGVAPYLLDTGLTPGRFYYYSIWLGQSSGNNETEAQAVWISAGNIVGLAVADFGWTDRLWNWIPRFYRYGANQVVADSDDRDQPLYKFVDVLGFHLNMINTDIDAARDLYNPDLMQYGALESYGASVGAELEPTVPARLNRQRIGNAAHDQLLRGTPQGLQNILTALTGWDVEIETGRNMLLDGDQSGPDHPGGHDWVYEYVYSQDEFIQYKGYEYKAKLTHQGRIPPDPGGENDYWAPIELWPTDLFQTPGTELPQATWQLSAPAADASFTVVSGLPNILVPNAAIDSGWQATNNGASPANFDVYFPGGTDYLTAPGMNEVIKTAVPVTTDMNIEALTASLHVYWAPGDTPAKVSPFLEFYDDLGIKLARVAKPFWAPIYDSFTNIFDIRLSDEITDTVNFWITSSDLWRISGKYVYLNTTIPGKYFAYFNMLRPDLSVAVTMSHVGTDRTNGLLLRYQDANNHIKVGATGVQTVVGGVTSTLASFSSPFVDGDRMSATTSGTSITIKKNNGNPTNGWSSTYTVSALTTPTYFGIWTTIA